MICRWADGRHPPTYIARRKLADIFRDGEFTISEAIRKGKASWALDDDTLLMLRAKGIVMVGVKCRDTHDVWMTTLASFLDPALAKPKDYARRSGARQRYLPLHHFRHKAGQVKL